jgi:hypothetical protein
VLAGEYVVNFGFRFATDTEVVALWRNAGAAGPITYSPIVESYAANYAAATTLIDLMGCTSDVLGVPCDGIDQDWQIGRFLQADVGQPYGLGIVAAFGAPDYRAGTAAMLIDWGTLDPGFYLRPDIGSYLVRSQVHVVPESPSLALAASALLILLAVGWTGRRNTIRQDPR